MTPQSILEDMARMEAKCGDRLSDFFDVGYWRCARDAVSTAVHFEFASACPKAEHIEFAEQMMEHDLFRLPFETVLFTGEPIPKTGILAFQYVENGKVNGLMWFTIAPAIDRDGESFSAPLMVAQLDARDHATGDPTHISRGTVDWASITKARHASRKTGKPWDDETYNTASEQSFSFIIGGTAMMMSKDVETRTETAPTKLNKRREQQGKPLIRERRVVVIKPERRASYANAAAEFAGLRSSPKMHWRRGHFRRVREDLIVPVAPSIINADVSTKPIAKQYRVEKGAV